MAGLRFGEVAVVGSHTGRVEALVAALRKKGIAAQAGSSEKTSGYIFLDGLEPVEEAEQTRGMLLSAFALAQQAARNDAARLFVTVQDTGGAFGLEGIANPAAGALAGLAKTADLEWSQIAVKAIDLEVAGREPSLLATALVDELLSGAGDVEVGLRADGQRICLRSELSPLPASTSAPLEKGAVVLCSGGGRGVTAATMIALAERCSESHFVLLGRTQLQREPAACHGVDGDAALKRALLVAAKESGQLPKPAELGKQVRRILAQREIRSTLKAIEAAGCSADYLAVDVTDAADLASQLARVRSQHGPVRCLVHGAGVVADKAIADKTSEMVERVLAPKLDGLEALLNATQNDPLDALVLFSSVAARTGNVGQCDYAMANEWLNKRALFEAKKRGVCVKSLNWGPWEAGMVTPALKAYFESHGVALIDLQSGARMLVDELAVRDDEVEIVLGGAPKRATIAGDSSSSTRYEIHVDEASYPQLIDHSVDGRVVVPMVFVLEWFTRAVRAATGNEPQGIHELRALRGLTVADFSGAGATLAIEVEVLADHCMVAIYSDGPQKAPHYRARATFGDGHNKVPPPSLQLQPFDGQAYEGEALFHGEQFQVIDKVLGVGDDGMAAHLHGSGAMNWSGGPWLTEPAAFDGALQLAIFWASLQLGGQSLPTYFGSYHRYAPLAEERFDCRLSGRCEAGTKTISDISIYDLEGRLLARFEGVETHKRP